MGYDALSGFDDPTLMFHLMKQMLPMMARTTVYRHIGPQPSVKGAETQSAQYVQGLRADALLNNAETGQHIKGVWASVYQFGTVAAAGFADMLRPLPGGFSECLFQKKCQPLAMATQDIVGDTLNFALTTPAKILDFMFNESPAPNAFDRAYAGTGVTLAGGLWVLNLIGLGKVGKTPISLDPMFPQSMLSGETMAMATSMAIDIPKVSAIDAGIVMLEASGSSSSGGKGDPNSISADEMRATLKNRQVPMVGKPKGAILQSILSHYFTMGAEFVDSAKLLSAKRITPQDYFQRISSSLARAELRMRVSVTRNPKIKVDPEAVGTVSAYNRALMLEVMRHSIEDIAGTTGEIPPDLSAEMDVILNSWPDLMARERWPARDQEIVLTGLDGFHHIDKTLVRAVRGAPVPLKDILAALERCAFEAVDMYEVMAQLLDRGMRLPMINSTLAITLQKFEKTGRLAREGALKIAHGETASVTPRLNKLMSILPLYSGQVIYVATQFSLHELKAPMSVHALLNAWPTVMGRPLPPEIAALLQRINAIVN